MSKKSKLQSQNSMPVAKKAALIFVGGAISIVAFVLFAASQLDSKAATGVPDSVITSSPHSYSKPVRETAQVKLNQPVADFEVTDVNGKRLKLSDWKGQLPLLFFADLSCPCVQAYNGRMKALQEKYEAQGLRIAYIFPAPEDGVDAIRQLAKTQNYPWPSVRDADQKLMRRFNVQCTTETFLLDRDGRLRYHGRVDESIFEPEKAKSHDLENAINALLQNKDVPVAETAAYACTIPRLPQSKTKGL
jgi:cytochrome oxidase Cu insertion factor (SCO1/SenC/PrrC family)